MRARRVGALDPRPFTDVGSSVPPGKVERAQVEVRIVEVGLPQAAGGVSRARPGVHRIVGGVMRLGAPREVEGPLEEQRCG